MKTGKVIKLFIVSIIMICLFSGLVIGADTDSLVVTENGNVGIGTMNPGVKLDVNGGIIRQNGFTQAVTDVLSAAATQTKRFEIARATIDYNDWNAVGVIEIELLEFYYSKGLKKKYYVWWGYSDDAGAYLAETGGKTGGNNFQVTIGSKVLIGGDLYYIPIYVDVRYYGKVKAVIKTNRLLTTSNPPEIGTIFIDTSPIGTDINDFHADSTAYVNYGFTNVFTGNVGIGTTNPESDLHVKGRIQQGNRFYTYAISGSTPLNTEFSHDIYTCGASQVVHIEAAITHWSAGYRATVDKIFYMDSYTTLSADTIMDNSTETAGSWSFQRIVTGNNGHGDTSDKLRITHNAGSYIGGANYYIYIKSTCPIYEM